MDAREFSAGSTIAGRYRLRSVLGRGGMGSVWRAEHLALGSEVAVKLIDPAIAGSDEARARFVREARAAAALRSPHVVQVLDFGVEGLIPFIVMELMKGESLAERLARVGRLAPEETSRIMTDVARALTKAHEAGIVHRDLKPDNVFLVDNDDQEVAKVLDFGVARVTDYSTDQAHMTSTGAVLGTPYYMSPEQAEGSRELDHRTDIWALAVMTFECLVGQRPFQAETIGGLFVAICARDIPTPSRVAEVPPGFDAWFERGTARVLAERFPTARDAARALRAVCVDERSIGASSLRAPGALDATVAAPSTGAPLPGNSARVSERPSRAEEALTATSTGGLAHTHLPAVPTKKVPRLAWLTLGAAVVAGAVMAALASRPDPEVESDASAASSAASSDAVEPRAAAQAEVPEPELVAPEADTTKAHPTSDPVIAGPTEPEPVASAEASQKAPSAWRAPKPAKATATRASTSSSNTGRTATTSPPTEKPAERKSEPAPTKVDLGI